MGTPVPAGSTSSVRLVANHRRNGHLRPNTLIPAGAVNGNGVHAAASSGAALSPPPRIGEYRCIVVDPPWDQGKTGLRSVRPNQGTDLSYPTMTYAELAELPVADWSADVAFLWLWATNSRSRSSGRPIMQQAFDLLDEWGFRYYTILTWHKGTGPTPFGPYQITSEHCLFAYRGKFEVPADAMGKAQTTLMAPKPTRHSEKPTALYEHIYKHFGGPRLDVFARRRHRGFDVWGNEAEQI